MDQVYSQAVCKIACNVLLAVLDCLLQSSTNGIGSLCVASYHAAEVSVSIVTVACSFADSFNADFANLNINQSMVF